MGRFWSFEFSVFEFVSSFEFSATKCTNFILKRLYWISEDTPAKGLNSATTGLRLTRIAKYASTNFVSVFLWGFFDLSDMLDSAVEA